MTTININLESVRKRIAQACAAAGRQSGEVALLAVSKTFGPDDLVQAYGSGQRAFGENYIQEAVEKMTALAELDIEWHCIGPIQSNKTRLVAEHFDWVHTVDRLKTAERLSQQRPANLAPLQVCLQVNIDAGANKSGATPSEVLQLAQAVAGLDQLKLRGLMCIPEPAIDFEAQCALFKRAEGLFHDLNARGMGMDTLSMGMTADLEAAIHCGSTMVRVGTAIFGGRPAFPTAR
jgi:pyridoxal phosphate enzyme (YggS family)